jgi:hypothetical protein
MKKLLKKINNNLEKYSLGIQIGIFLILLTELLHFLKYSNFSIDFMMVEVFALIFIVLILNTYDVEKGKKKMILKIIGLILLFLLITFTTLFDYISGENFICCEKVFDWILK